MARLNDEYPVTHSIGYLTRAAYRAFTQELQSHLAKHDVSIGMWYFLRALWHEDGIAQSELSQRVGSTGPTTVEQLNNMEASGLIVRKRSIEDRRKIHVYLSPKGRRLRPKLMPYVSAVDDVALAGFSIAELGFLRLSLIRIIENLSTGGAASPVVVLPSVTGRARSGAGKVASPIVDAKRVNRRKPARKASK